MPKSSKGLHGRMLITKQPKETNELIETSTVHYSRILVEELGTRIKTDSMHLYCFRDGVRCSVVCSIVFLANPEALREVRGASIKREKFCNIT